MKDEWIKYLENIGADGPFLEKVEAVASFYELIYPDQLEDILVTDYIDEDGQRQFENLWFFTQSLLLEAKNFLTQEDYDCAPFKNQIKYWDIKKKNYDFKASTPTSRFNLEFSLAVGISAHMKVSGNNCDQLKHIFEKYIIPNPYNNA